MPTNRSLTGPRAKLAGLSNRKRGTPEHNAAAQEFYYLLLSQKVTEILGKAPPLSQSQREDIIAILHNGGGAPV